MPTVSDPSAAIDDRRRVRPTPRRRRRSRPTTSRSRTSRRGRVRGCATSASATSAPSRSRACRSTCTAREITALIGPSGCGKSTLLRSFNRMNDLDRRRRGVGPARVPRSRPLRARRRPGRGAAPHRHGVPEAEPVPEVDLRQRRVRAAHQRAGARASTTSSRRRCVNAALWDEVKDKLKQSAFALSGGQQQRLCIARCLAVRARRDPDGRAVLGARPDRDRRASKISWPT